MGFCREFPKIWSFRKYKVLKVLQSELEGRIAFKTMRVIPNFFYSCVVQRKWCAPLLPHPHLLMGHLSAHQLDGASPHRVSCCNLLKPLLASQYECAFFCAVLHSLKGIFFFRGEHRATSPKNLAKYWTKKCTHFSLQNTTLQSMMNAKLSLHGFWHCHENRLIKMIQTIPHNLYPGLS